MTNFRARRQQIRQYQYTAFQAKKVFPATEL